ncbi:hypothetical protein ACFWOG_27920 [Kitasatospora sp. NPDC058406]|uniref:hypothetical protein n=1 Tax=Kitasatospora sp. NPDC058406 TaxID=3346483 RepID=UPI00364C2496
MTVAALVAHGWEGFDGADALLYAVAFGIVTAALVERIGNKPGANLAYVLPVGFGVLAGLVAGAIRSRRAGFTSPPRRARRTQGE